MKPTVIHISHLFKFYAGRRFTPFIAASIAIHTVLLCALPGPSEKNPRIKPETFQVDLIPPPSEISKKIIPTPLTKVPPQEKIKKVPVTKGSSKKIGSLKNDSPLQEEEATVTLFTDEHKDTKYSAYLAHLKQKIGSIWEYPVEAKEKHLQGELTLRFSLRPDGSLVDVKILEFSRHPVINQDTVRTIYAAAPFKPFPKEFTIARLNVLATFKYQIAAD